MAKREFNLQVLKTKAQWKSGLANRLILDADGLSLFLNPVFDSWLVRANSLKRAGDIVVDECGQTYWTATETSQREPSESVWSLFRHNPTTDQIERVLSFSGCGPIEPRELWLSTDYLWVFDHVVADDGVNDAEKKSRTGRMLALTRDNFQIVHEFSIESLIDIDFDKHGFFYSLVNEAGDLRLCRYALPPQRPGPTDCFKLKEWKEPAAIAVGPDGLVYVLDVTAPHGRIIRFDPTSKKETFLGASQEKLLSGFKPSAMQIDERGVIFLATSLPAALHMFDADGSYLGQAELPSSIITRIGGIGFDRKGGVYLATDQGLARFSLSKNPVGQDGVFYSKTLDNGVVESFWHRLVLEGQIPNKSSVEVSYYASDNKALKVAHDQVLTGPLSAAEKAAEIERLFGSRWSTPETFSGSQKQDVNSIDLLFDPDQGRFLWFKLRLITFDQTSRPFIRSARIYYPRLSYLRYLPPAYREEPTSAAFLEKFLSLFETVFEGLDNEIDQLFRYFDAGLAPRTFLPWLSSWINLSLDDDVPEDRVRRLIQRAPYLYSRKGTREALTEFLEIYSGRRVFVTEHARGFKPLILGPGFELGRGTILLGSGPKGFRLGHTSVVGHAAVRDRVSDADEPFLTLARRFTIVIDMDREEFEKRAATLLRIVTEQKPAHTSCTLRPTAEQRTLGSAVLGVSASVTGVQPYRVGMTPLGTGSALAKGRRALRLERGAWVGSSGRL